MRKSEEQWVSAYLAGEQGAADALYAAHSRRVMAYFTRSGFDAADAEDRTQETFVRAFRSLATFDTRRGTLSAWLGAVARNVARKHWRRRSSGEHFDPELAERVLEAPGNSGDLAEAREEIAAVRDCVDRLPDELGRIVRLRYVEARTTRGIAAATGISEATVRLRLSQARAELARCLRGKGVLE